MGWRASRCTDLLSFAVILIVRQVRMEVERGDVFEQAQLVEIAESGERRDLLRAFDDRRTEPVLIDALARRAPSSASGCTG